MKSLSRVRLFATPWTAASQAPLSMGFSRHEYWSGVPLPSPGDLTDSGIEPRSPALQADALSSKPLSLDLKKKKKVGIFVHFNLRPKPTSTRGDIPYSYLAVALGSGLVTRNLYHRLDKDK